METNFFINILYLVKDEYMKKYTVFYIIICRWGNNTDRLFKGKT